MVDPYAVAGVADPRIPVGGGADEIAVQHVSGGIGIYTQPVPAVARNEVAERWHDEYWRHGAFGAGGIVGHTGGGIDEFGAADPDVPGPAGNPDAVAAVAGDHVRDNARIA